MNTPAILTLGKASKLLGRTKPTVSNWIENGDLPAGRNEKKHYQIQLADLQRLYPDLLREQELKLEGNSKDDTKNLHHVTPDNTDELHLIKSLLAKLETSHQEVLNGKDEAIKNLNVQLAETKALTDQRTSEAKAIAQELASVKVDIELTPKIKKRPLGFFERFRLKEIIEIEEAEEVA